jgi:repressor LexA
MVVALIEDEATVKRIYPESDRIRLQPSNPSMKPIYIQRSAHRQISILGVVVGVLRRL